MEKKCQSCTRSMKESEKFCANCGEEYVEKTQETKINPKMKWSIIAGAIILLFAGHQFLHGYYSPKSLEKRFESAVDEGDPIKLTKIATHEDKTPITEGEAEAFLELIDEEGQEVIELFTELTYDTKRFGLYDSYKIVLIDQFVYYDQNDEDLSFLFNYEEIPVFDEDEDYIEYGPLAPGIYQVGGSYDGEHSFKSDYTEITLSSTYSEAQYANVDLNIAMVTFYVENHALFDHSEAAIIFGDEKLAIGEDGYTEEIGPVILDDYDSVIQTVVEMPWGTVTSDEIQIEEEHQLIQAALLSEVSPEQYEDIKETITEVGEQYLQTFAHRDTSYLTVGTENFESQFSDSFTRFNYYAGKLKKIMIDKESIYIPKDSYEPTVNLDVKFIVDETDPHISFDEYFSNDRYIEENEFTWSLYVTYDLEDERWYADERYNGELDEEDGEIEEIDGLNKLYELD